MLKYQLTTENATKLYKTVGNCGIDLSANNDYNIKPQTAETIFTDIKIQIPLGYVGKIYGRSGIAQIYSLSVLAGTINFIKFLF